MLLLPEVSASPAAICDADGRRLPTPFWKPRVMARFNPIRVSGEAIILSCAVVFFLAVMHLEALGQDKRPAPVTSQKPEPGSLSTVPTYSNSELDRTTYQLPASFKGNDIALVSRQLSERRGQVEKSEFETSEQWQHRLTTLWSK